MNVFVNIAHGEAHRFAGLDLVSIFVNPVSILVKVDGLTRDSTGGHPWGAPDSIPTLLLLCQLELLLLSCRLLSSSFFRQALA